MPYDKYRNWPIPSQNVSIASASDLKRLVLKDLAATSDDIEKLEILDSFEAWAQRACGASLALMVSRII